MKRSIKTFDGHKINYVYRQGINAKPDQMVLMLHGIFSNHTENGRYDRLANALNNAGFNTLNFDFRGHGESNFSTQEFSISGAINDLQAVIKTLQEDGYKYVQLIASSFSACIAILANAIAQKNTIVSIAFLNPVVDLYNTVLLAKSENNNPYFNPAIINNIFLNGSAILENGFVVSSQFFHELSFIKPYDFIQHLRIPTIVFHGTADEKVDFKISTTHFIKATNCKIVLIDEATHAFKDPDKEKIVFDGLVEWVLENSVNF
ncbi:MAG: alpha/beta fold hydrolase [Pseudomonadota bacterium]